MNYDFVINDNQMHKMVAYYHQFLENTNDSRILYSFKNPDFKIIIFNTKKVLFQGKKAFEEYEKWCTIFDFKIVNKSETPTYTPTYKSQKIIGSDEVGTGDFFGPIVVCAAYLTPNDLSLVSELGVRDSKALNDQQIITIGEALIKHISYHVLVLQPEKYNALVAKGYNMNKIKAYLHNHALRKLVKEHPSFDNIIVDEFCSPKNYYGYLEGQNPITNICFHTKGESIHPAVAAASIIARYKFLMEMDDLSKRINITIPKGAGAPVDAIGKLILLQHGRDIFKSIAKINFKNMERIK